MAPKKAAPAKKGKADKEVKEKDHHTPAATTKAPDASADFEAGVMFNRQVKPVQRALASMQFILC